MKYTIYHHRTGAQSVRHASSVFDALLSEIAGYPATESEYVFRVTTLDGHWNMAITPLGGDTEYFHVSARSEHAPS